MDYVGMVREFHAKMNLENPETEVFNLSSEIRKKRIRLIAEESAELIVAMDENNLEQIADAACDLVYVQAGTAVCYGFKTLPLPHNAGADTVMAVASSTHRAAMLMSKVIANNYFLNVAMEKEVGQRVWDELRNSIRGVLAVAHAYLIPFNECFAEVHRSNMTKTPLNEHRKGGKGPGYTPPNLKAIFLSNDVQVG